jgi:hypothetical protein
MLTDLDFLQNGQPWPPKSEAARLKLYEENEALRDEEVSKIWPNLYKYLRDGTTAEQDFYIGVPWIITKKAIDTITGEPPVFSDGDIELVVPGYFLEVLQEQIADIDVYGDSVLKIYLDGSNAPKIESVEPCHWFPVTQKGTRDIIYHVLAFEFTETVKDKETHFLEIEIHSPNMIEHRIYELQASYSTGGSAIIGDLQDVAAFKPDLASAKLAPDGLSRFEDHNLGEFLVIDSHNQRTSGELFGRSSYTPSLKSILKRLIIRYSLANNILDVFSRPTLVGPRNMETYDPVTGKSIFRPGEYKGLNLDPGVSPFVPQAITWDGHLPEAETQIGDLEEKLYIVAELPKAILSMEATGAAASGVAWKLAMTPLLAKCARIRRTLDLAAKQALNVAFALEGAQIEPSIQWQDGLPDIPIEIAQEFSLLSNSPAFAGEQGIIWLLKTKLGMSEEEAVTIATDSSRNGGLGGMV